MAGRMAERWYTRLSSLFEHELRGRQAVMLYGSGSQFRQTNVVEGDLGEGTGGVTEAYKRRIVLPFAGPIETHRSRARPRARPRLPVRHHQHERDSAGAGPPGAM